LRDEAELPLAREAIAAGVPLLGICRGMQVINVSLGGSLRPDHSVVVATAPDDVIEAIEVPAAPAFCIGVQWEVQEEPSRPLLALSVELRRRTQPPSPRPGVGTSL
jgi:gamma-glutamyl-gamma-aminobutyrate hydrolase PuuD